MVASGTLVEFLLDPTITFRAWILSGLKGFQRGLCIIFWKFLYDCGCFLFGCGSLSYDCVVCYLVNCFLRDFVVFI